MLSITEKEHKILQELCKRDECKASPNDQEILGLVEKGFAELVIRITMAGFKEVAHYVPRKEANDNATE